VTSCAYEARFCCRSVEVAVLRLSAVILVLSVLNSSVMAFWCETTVLYALLAPAMRLDANA